VKLLTAIWLGLGLLAACKADIPDAVFACNADSDCPSGFECRSEDADGNARYCYASGAEHDGGRSDAAGQAGRDGGGGAGKPAVDAGFDAGVDRDGGPDAGPAAPPALGPIGFSTLRERRSGGGLTLYDDGFERGDRLCSSNGRLCVTGGFEP